MSIVKQKGILNAKSDFKTDSDVIMTVALIGHAYERLMAGKNCRIDFEVKDPYNPGPEVTDIENHHQAISKVNLVLANGGCPSNRNMQLGITPVYDVEGDVTTIIGGTGDKHFTEADRYNPGVWNSGASKELYNLALGKAVDRKGMPIQLKIGYQGSGAYTGFIAGRKGGQSNLMSTYRFLVPDLGRRWVPSSDSVPKNWFGLAGDQHKAWGTLGNNNSEHTLSSAKGGSMYFQDEDKNRPQTISEPDQSIVGYVHGMIQAIYDVELHKMASGGKSGGVPYEIAVGEKTSKLASCFACAVFMEANGYPASATHIGRSDSWCIVHATGHVNSKTENDSRNACNEKWANYCKQIINSGMNCLVTSKRNLLAESHEFSFAALKGFLQNKQEPYDYANLLLDALTVHGKICEKVNACIR